MTRHKFKYDTGFFKTNIYEWVEISGSPNSGTGSVVQAINSTIAGQDLDFPNVKEYLSHYTDNSPSPKIE